MDPFRDTGGRRVIGLLLLLPVLLAWGCSGGGGGGPSGPAVGSVTVTPGEGGSVVSDDGRLRLDFPPGAVVEDVVVSVSAVPAAEAPAEAFPAGIAYRLEPSGLQLAVPAQETFTFSRADMAAAAQADFDPLPAGTAGTDYVFPIELLAIADNGTLDALGNQQLDGGVAGASLTVTGEIHHFSLTEAHALPIFLQVPEATEPVGQTQAQDVAISTTPDLPAGAQLLVTGVQVGSTAVSGGTVTSQVQTPLPVTYPPDGLIVVSHTCTTLGSGTYSVVLTGVLTDLIGGLEVSGPYELSSVQTGFTCTPAAGDEAADAGSDVASDAASDAPSDAGSDALADAASDALADAASDALVDAGSDALADAGSDGPTDSGSDAPTDGGDADGGGADAPVDSGADLYTPPDCVRRGGGPDHVVTFGSVHDHGWLHSGFIEGWHEYISDTVEVSLDGGPFVNAQVDGLGLYDWRFALPLPSVTPWRENTLHTIAVRARDFDGVAGNTTTITVRKGANEDINGDGYPDLVVGAPFRSPGRAYVFLTDSYCGISATLAIASLYGPSATLTGASATDNFGNSLALDDINGDGYADLVVGAYAGFSGAGNVYVFYASNSGAGITVTSATEADATITAERTYSQFAYSVAAGDVTGDGYADVIAGAPLWYVTGAPTGYGRIYVFNSGGTSGITATTAVAGDGGPDTTISGALSPAYELGFSLAAGDVNGDGYMDLITGAVTSGSTGRVYIFNASNTGAGIPATSSADAQTVITGTTDERLGWSVATGDVNGDGYADVAVGGHLGASGAGRAYVFLAADTGLGIAATASASADTIITGEESSTFGVAVALGDVNGDGYDDLAVGAPIYSSSTGRAYVFHSTGAGGITATTATTGEGGPSFTITGESTDSRFGSAVLISDVNADGIPALVVAAEYFASQIGRVYEFPSSGSGGIAADGDTALGARISIIGETYNNRFGNALR